MGEKKEGTAFHGDISQDYKHTISWATKSKFTQIYESAFQVSIVSLTRERVEGLQQRTFLLCKRFQVQSPVSPVKDFEMEGAVKDLGLMRPLESCCESDWTALT